MVTVPPHWTLWRLDKVSVRHTIHQKSKAIVNQIFPESDEVYRLPIFRLVDFGLRKVLWKMSALLVRSPTLLIVIPLVLAAISSVGLILRREELSLQMPFTSYFSPSESSGHVAELHFNSSQPRYDAINRLSGTDFAVLIETKGDDNILREELIDNYLQLKKRIESIRVRQGDNSFDFASLCRRTDGSCEINVVEKLLARKIGVQLRYPEIQPADYHNQHQQSGIPNGTKLFLGTTFGGVEKDPEGNMAGAKSLAMYFKLGTAETEELARRKWQVEFDAVAASAAAGINATVQFWSFATFSSEVIRQFEEIRNCLAGSLAILVVSVLLLHSATSCYTSRPWLGLAGVVATLTSFMSAMGIVVGAEGRLEPDISSFLLFSAGEILIPPSPQAIYNVTFLRFRLISPLRSAKVLAKIWQHRSRPGREDPISLWM